MTMMASRCRRRQGLVSGSSNTQSLLHPGIREFVLRPKVVCRVTGEALLEGGHCSGAAVELFAIEVHLMNCLSFLPAYLTKIGFSLLDRLHEAQTVAKATGRSESAPCAPASRGAESRTSLGGMFMALRAVPSPPWLQRGALSWDTKATACRAVC